MAKVHFFNPVGFTKNNIELYGTLFRGVKLDNCESLLFRRKGVMTNP